MYEMIATTARKESRLETEIYMEDKANNQYGSKHDGKSARKHVRT